MVADANLRVNLANVRAVRSAGTSAIVSNMGAYDNTTGTANPMMDGLKDNAGWVVIAKVDGHGDVSGMQIYVVADVTESATPKYYSGVIKTSTTPSGPQASDATGFVKLEDSVHSEFAGVKPGETGYYVQAVISNVEYDAVETETAKSS